MRFIFYSPVSFEPWDWRNSVEKGIGGSETSHVEMAWRLARRGHEVITYAPIPDDCPGEWRGTIWRPLEEVDTDMPGIWVIYRCPEFMDGFPKHEDQKVWLILQDWDYPTWTQERVDKLDRIVPLCQAHSDWIAKRHPDLDGFFDKLWVSSNGIKLDLIAEAEKENIERNPFRIMHASSPDRGLLPLLKIFRKAKEYVPDLELHAFYGFDNIDKLIAQGGPGGKHFANLKERILKEAAREGVTLHGRVSQNQLYREWFKSGIYCYITSFWETSNISSQEAQAMGAVPVFSPIWAQGENIKYGIAVDGSPDEPLTICRAAAEIVNLATNPKLQEEIRTYMMPSARTRFDWENFVTQWEKTALYDMEPVFA